MTYLSHIPSGINPFYTTGLFLCPLKTSENLRVIFSGGIERDQWYDIDYYNTVTGNSNRNTLNEPIRI